jgi:hypothetical protein
MWACSDVDTSASCMMQAGVANISCCRDLCPRYCPNEGTCSTAKAVESWV